MIGLHRGRCSGLFTQTAPLYVYRLTTNTKSLLHVITVHDVKRMQNRSISYVYSSLRVKFSCGNQDKQLFDVIVILKITQYGFFTI